MTVPPDVPPDLPPGLEILSLIKSGAAGAVFRGRLAGREVLVKHWSSPGGAAAADAAAQALVRAAHLGAGPFRVPLPVALHPELALLISQFVPGPTVQAALAAGAGRDELLARAGGWLAALVATGRHQGRLMAHYWARTRAADLHELAARTQIPGLGQLAQQLSERLSRGAAALHGTQVTRGTGHGDLGPQNLIIAPDALFGVDLELMGPFPVLRDVARLAVTTHLRLPRESGPQGDIAQDCAAILSAGLVPDDEAARLLPFFVVVELATRLTRNDLSGPRGAALLAAARAYAG